MGDGAIGQWGMGLLSMRYVVWGKWEVYPIQGLYQVNVTILIKDSIKCEMLCWQKGCRKGKTRSGKTAQTDEK